MKLSWRHNPLEGRRTDGCVWCGSEDLTGEHLISSWILRGLELPIGVSFDGAQLKKANHPVASGLQSLDTSTVKSWVVCGKCNSGWMKDLEDEVKPFLKPMIEGKEVELSDPNLTTLSIWACMKAVCVDYREPSRRQSDLSPDGISSKHARAKILDKQIPSRFQVGVAAFNYPSLSIESFPYQRMGSRWVASYKPIFFRIGFLAVLINFWTGGHYAPSKGSGFLSDDSFLVTHPAEGGRRSWPPKQVLTNTELNSVVSRKLGLPAPYRGSLVRRAELQSPINLPITGETKNWRDLWNLDTP